MVPCEVDLLHTTKLRGGVSKPGNAWLGSDDWQRPLGYVAGTATLADRMEVVGWLTVREYQGSK